MFDILKIEIKDFKSFSGVTEFEFPTEPGLYNLTGKNEYSPRLGTNGIGKSSFIDASFWVKYGNTTRGLRASDVITWGKKNCYVEETLLIDGGQYKIRREQNPNNLTIDGEISSQDEVNKLLRINQEAFVYSVVLPQFGSSFLDLTPSPKLTLFSQVMGLDNWLELSKAATIKSSTLEDKVNSLESKKSSYSGKLSSIRETIKDLKTNAAKFEDAQKQKVTELTIKAKDIKNELIEAEKEYNKIAGSSKKKDVKVKTIGKEISTIETDLFKLTKEEQEVNGEESNIRKRVKGLQRDIDDFDSMVGLECVTCKQVVDKKHTKKHIDVIKENINKEMIKLKEIKEYKNVIETNKENSNKKLLTAKKKLLELRKLIDKMSSKENNAFIKVRTLSSSFDQINAKIDEEKNRVNPYRKMLADNRKKITALKADLAEIKESINIFTLDYESTLYWVNGFKKIRLHLIEDALRSLEIEMNNNLVSLGLIDWKITLDVERETKSGGVSKGFSVFIHSPKHPEPVRYEAFSGGETQRLRLAGDFALANLILERAGLVGKYEIYDEPSPSLSEEGLEDLVEALYERAHKQSKKILFVDHHSIDSGYFDEVIKIIMQKDGKSSISFRP